MFVLHDKIKFDRKRLKFIFSMEIKQIKQRLQIEDVLSRYGLKADRNNRINCPFHDDKTPSMQVYPKTGTWTCFSSNCDAGSGDQIDFIMKKESCTKHQAILRAKEMLGVAATTATPPETESFTRTAVLTKIFTSFRNGMLRSTVGKEYLESRALDPERLEVGYNSGQFHHNGKVNKSLLESYVKYGLLRSGVKGGYQVFGKGCVCFALRDGEEKVVGLYFRSTQKANSENNQARHFYLKDRQGLYPRYPRKDTTKLILTEAVIDAATLLQEDKITANYSVLALYGTNGLTIEHREAIQNLKKLEEIILMFDGDAAGKEAIKKYATALQELKSRLKVSYVEMPEGEDVNSVAVSHEKEILTHLIESRKAFFSSTELASIENKTKADPEQREETKAKSKIDVTNPYNIKYKGEIARYSIRGGLRNELDSLKVSIVIESSGQRNGPYGKYRNKVDLYENRQVERLAREAADKLDVRSDIVELDLHELTDHLEEYRDSQQQKSKNQTESPLVKIDPGVVARCRSLLEGPDLMKRLNQMIGQSGVVGESTNRLFLFIIATSYKMPDTLHALIQGSTGSGKTHLLERISRLMPQEEVKRFTRVTDSSFYNYGAYDLQNKLICLEDLDGMKEEAQLAFRELQSREMLSTSTTGQDEKGNLRSYEKVVYGPIASLACTTRGEIYEDNMSRCFIIAVDETREQTQRVIMYQNRKASGKIDTSREQEMVQLLQSCIRLIKPYPVINPYADKVQLPQEAHKIRRLNELYQSFVRQVTLVHQYKRQKDSKGRLISRKEDLLVAADIMFESILLKIDELDGSLRQFYERLKEYIKAMGGDHYDTYSFSQREIRMALNLSKSQLQRYIYDLISLEYIALNGGHVNRGYRYRVIYWDDITRIRGRLKRHLEGQLAQLELMEVPA